MKAAEKAISIDPKSPKGYFIRGEVYSAQRKHQEAIKDYNRAYELDNKFLEAINQRAAASNLSSARSRSRSKTSMPSSKNIRKPTIVTGGAGFRFTMLVNSQMEPSSSRRVKKSSAMMLKMPSGIISAMPEPMGSRKREGASSRLAPMPGFQ